VAHSKGEFDVSPVAGSVASSFQANLDHLSRLQSRRGQLTVLHSLSHGLVLIPAPTQGYDDQLEAQKPEAPSQQPSAETPEVQVSETQVSDM